MDCAIVYGRHFFQSGLVDPDIAANANVVGLYQSYNWATSRLLTGPGYQMIGFMGASWAQPCSLV